jgi:hypothetical protein
MSTCRLNLGSLSARVSCRSSFHPDALAELFCAPATPLSGAAARPDIEIIFIEADRHAPQAAPALTVPEDSLVIVDSPAAQEVHSEALSVRLFRSETPVRIIATVLGDGMSERDFKVHLSVVFFKVLALLDRLILHAAAVDFGGAVSIFLGGKGSGKSTTCLQLARAGGTILAEDRVILKKNGGGFFVSGCGDRFRITAKTEQYFFPAPLQAESLDVEGVLKKQFPAGQFFRSSPYRDYPAARLFFNHVGGRFRITPISKGEALVNLLRETRAWHRFVGGQDHGRHLSYLRECVEALPAFRLELSPDLGESAKLADFLAGPCDP